MCSVIGCDRPNYGFGLCEKHWKRKRKGQSLTAKSVYEKTTQERFDEKWTKAANGCHNWNFAKPGMAPPRANTFLLGGRVMTAYRAAWIMRNGPIPRGLIIRHTCDNGLCVNTNHLEIGTHADNSADMDARNRRWDNRGMRCPTSVLTDDDVRRVRAEMVSAPRGTLARLTREFGVSKATLQDIIKGKTWKHLL